MSELVPADQVERIVGVPRHATRHFARAVSAQQTVYILHSQRCLDKTDDLRECWFSRALDNGTDVRVWAGHEDVAVRVTINEAQQLIPVVEGMRFANRAVDGH